MNIKVGTENSSFEKAAVDFGVHAAYAVEGYIQPDGSADKVKVREAMFEVLRPLKVTDKRERGAKAVTRGAMVEKVFPSLTGPDAFGDQEDPQLAQAIWKKIDGELWSMATPGAGSGLQRLVGLNMGNGYILCRTTIGKDQTSAVYITDDVGCIEDDFIRPDNSSLEQKIRTVTRNREMLIYRQPKNSKRYQGRFERTMKALSATASGQLMLAVEAVTVPTESDEDDEN